MKSAIFTVSIVLCGAFLAGCAPARDYAASRRAENLLGAGWEALSLGDSAEAEAFFEKAESLRPSGDMLARIGLAYHFHGRFRDALPWLERALKAEPNQPWAVQVALAAGYAADGRLTQARQLMAEALEKLPEDPIILNNTAYVMADKGVLLDEVIIILERAVKKAPEEGVILDSLAWAHFRKGEFEKALPMLEKAARLAGDPEIRLHLSQAREAMESAR
jgi:tetratricopeptide (TPR) repeat protein